MELCVISLAPYKPGMMAYTSNQISQDAEAGGSEKIKVIFSHTESVKLAWATGESASKRETNREPCTCQWTEDWSVLQGSLHGNEPAERPKMREKS